jgi:DNA polymerase III alpha subunit (gram-positive type)
MNILKNQIQEKNIFMFDCESDGLYGETFAVAVAVASPNGRIIDKIKIFVENYEPMDEWVKENVKIDKNNAIIVESTIELRNRFYDFYMRHKETSIVMSDCNYPVETNFLADVARDDLKERKFNMPYPLFDLSNFLDVSISRKEYSELQIEGLEHDPLVDCYYSIAAYIKLNK